MHTTYKAHNTHMWYLDSGCSRHTSGDRSLFAKVEKYDGGLVTFRDGKKSRVIGKGTIGTLGNPTLNDVLLVDGLKANLLSISQICDSEHEVYFFKEACIIIDKHGKSIMRGERTNDNCYCILPKPYHACNSAKLEDFDLWHHRLGHMNFRDLSYLSNHEIVKGLPKLGKPSNAIYGPCQLGKQTKAAHKKINSMITFYPLKLIHIDLMGPTWT